MTRVDLGQLGIPQCISPSVSFKAPVPKCEAPMFFPPNFPDGITVFLSARAAFPLHLFIFALYAPETTSRHDLPRPNHVILLSYHCRVPR